MGHRIFGYEKVNQNPLLINKTIITMGPLFWVLKCSHILTFRYEIIIYIQLFLVLISISEKPVANSGKRFMDTLKQDQSCIQYCTMLSNNSLQILLARGRAPGRTRDVTRDRQPAGPIGNQRGCGPRVCIQSERSTDSNPFKLFRNVFDKIGLIYK